MKDLHQTITDQIIQSLEQGVKPWECPWLREQGGRFALPVNFKTGDHYHGINVLLLWISTQEKNYTSNGWLTFNQARELGGHVRKGEKATLAVFYKKIDKTLHPDDPDYPG